MNPTDLEIYMEHGIRYFPKKCTCCGESKLTLPCTYCKLEVCSNCTSFMCLICMAKRGFVMTNQQQKQLETVYLPGGFQFEQAKSKFDNITK